MDKFQFIVSVPLHYLEKFFIKQVYKWPINNFVVRDKIHDPYIVIRVSDGVTLKQHTYKEKGEVSSLS